MVKPDIYFGSMYRPILFARSLWVPEYIHWLIKAIGVLYCRNEYGRNTTTTTLFVVSFQALLVTVGCMYDFILGESIL